MGTLGWTDVHNGWMVLTDVKVTDGTHDLGSVTRVM